MYGIGIQNLNEPPYHITFHNNNHFNAFITNSNQKSEPRQKEIKDQKIKNDCKKSKKNLID